MSKCNSPSDSLLLIAVPSGRKTCLARSGLMVIPELSRKPGIMSQRNRADSRMCRWDSDDLSDISDDEWDDDA